MSQYMEDPVDEGPTAIHVINIWTRAGGGKVLVKHWTNDDEDRGYPTRDASWREEFDTLAEALERTGYTRDGVLCSVVVSLNGKKIFKPKE